MKNIVADLILVLLLGSSGFFVFLSYKMDKDPFWAQVACILFVIFATIFAGGIGWVSGSSWEHDLPLFSFYHIVAVILMVIAAAIGYFISGMMAIAFLYNKASEKNWTETIQMLEKARLGY